MNVIPISQNGDNPQMRATLMLAKVIEERHIGIPEPDIEMIKGLWPIQVLVKLSDVVLDTTWKFFKDFVKKSPDFFKAAMLSAYFDNQERAKFMKQVVDFMQGAGYNEKYAQIESNRGMLFSCRFPLSFFLFIFFFSFFLARNCPATLAVV